MAQPVYTEQTYAFTEGKVLLADRAYIAAAAVVPPAVKQDGATPASYTDLGSIHQSQVTIEKAEPDIIDVVTGLFEVLRDQVARKDGDMTGRFVMVEYEPAAWAALTGDAEVAVAGGTSIFIGGRPLLQNAVLFIGQSPVTDTEFHHYNPKSNMSFRIVDTDRFQTIEVTVRFLKFTDGADPAALSRDIRLFMF